MTPVETDAYRISKARYAKGKIAIHCKPDGSGLKTRAARLLSAIAGNSYSNREKSYIVSPRQAEKFLKLFTEGRDADLGDCNGVLGYKL